MVYEKICLNSEAYLEVYIADKVGDRMRNALLVIPGGAYSRVCSDREGEPIAMAFMPYGFNAFVLHYSAGKKAFPSHLIEASLAMKHIRDNAERYGIDSKNVFVVGFSAGGHLAASLGTMWHRKEIYDSVDMDYGYNRPLGMMLIYPVVSYKYPQAHSFNNLLMEKEPSEEKLKDCSIECNVSEKTCPAYIVHTYSDTVVPVKHSLCLAEALENNGVEFELHIYPDAPHGFALANEITMLDVDKWCNKAIQKWISQAIAWSEHISKNDKGV